MTSKFTNVSLLLFVLMTAACAPKEFSAVNEGEVGLSSLGGDGSGSGGGGGEMPATGEPDGTDPGGTDPVTIVYPNIKMLIPTCSVNQSCQIRVQLNRTDAKSVSYKWQTDDTKYMSDPGRYAQPGVHYVATYGTVYFNAGVTEQTMAIQTLSGFTEIMIPFLFGECKYDNKPVDCAAYKFVLTRI